MKNRRFIISLILILFSLNICFAIPKDSTYKKVGLDYIVEANGSGNTEASAKNDALRNAYDTLMESLGKDKLFSELFMKNLPITMLTESLSVNKGIGGTYTVRIKITVDDESLVIINNNIYLSSVSSILDQAEECWLDAEKLANQAQSEESNGRIAKAMSLYWQSKDLCVEALSLVSPIGDAAVFSSNTRKKAPELREILESLEQTVSSGYARIKELEKTLAADAELAASIDAFDSLEAEVDEIKTWADGIGDRVARIESTAKAELKAFSLDLAKKVQILKDSKANLKRIQETIPKRNDLLLARIEVTNSKINSTEKYLSKSKSNVDKEIRDPAVARAKRAQTFRWVMLHEPIGAISIRLYSPFGIDPYAEEFTFIGTDNFEFNLHTDVAVGKNGGIWIATELERDDTVLCSLDAFNNKTRNTSYSQSVDLGFYKNMLWAGGFSWDWTRAINGIPADKRMSLRLSTGQINSAGTRAFWLARLSWELPYEKSISGGFVPCNIFNFGLDGLLRIGSFAELNAGLSWRPRQNIYSTLDSVFSYSVGGGFRAPKAFLWGIELNGSSAKSVNNKALPVRKSLYIRMFVEYSI